VASKVKPGACLAVPVQDAVVRVDLPATPICDDASLLKLNEEVAEYVREAKRGDHLRPDELVSTVVDGVARSYFSENKRA
jgi:hypothetical protein